MTIAYWIIAGLTALIFVAAGIFKLTQPKDVLKDKGLAWTEDYSARAVKGIAAVEVAGALGLILPAATGILPFLAPLAGLGLAVIMALAIRMHRRRKESIVANVVLGALAIASAVLGVIVWL